jgi:multidrug efflux pump
LRDIYLNTQKAGNVPLAAVATSRASTTALAVNHSGLFPSVTVSFNLAPNVSLSQATAEIEQMKARLGAPSTVRGSFSGTAAAYQASLST